jgi:hypothetical protein
VAVNQDALVLAAVAHRVPPSLPMAPHYDMGW